MAIRHYAELLHGMQAHVLHSGIIGGVSHFCMDAAMHKIQVGNRLRLAIEALGKSQAEVARQLGISPTKLGNWIRGDNYPSNLMIVRLGERYSITADWLLRGVLAGMVSPLADDLWQSVSASGAELTAAAPLVNENKS